MCFDGASMVYTIFSSLLLNRGYACASIVLTRGNQLVPEHLLKLADT